VCLAVKPSMQMSMQVRYQSHHMHSCHFFIMHAIEGEELHCTACKCCSRCAFQSSWSRNDQSCPPAQCLPAALPKQWLEQDNKRLCSSRQRIHTIPSRIMAAKQKPVKPRVKCDTLHIPCLCIVMLMKNSNCLQCSAFCMAFLHSPH